MTKDFRIITSQTPIGHATKMEEFFLLGRRGMTALWTARVGFALGCLVAGNLVAAEPSTLIRGINLNGPALEIDGQRWEPGDSPTSTVRGNAFENQAVPLKPPIDESRSRMLRSSRWGRDISVELKELPPGEFQVCVYVWEDNASATYSLFLNDKRVLDRFQSGDAGTWRRLGPWRARSIDGSITLAARGGDANLSGIEIWSGEGSVPHPLASAFNSTPTADELAFFESRIRPLLINQCYECHSAESAELGGNLLLDSRPGILQGGDTEPPIVPGDPAASLLMRAVRHQDPHLTMPPGRKLSELELADLDRWIRLRAPDPRTATAAATRRPAAGIDWARAKDFWSLQPAVNRPLPNVSRIEWPWGKIDGWILARLEEEELSPAQDAERSTLLRRVTFDLTGLPPSTEELEDFLADTSPTALDRVVDRLLSSPHYGARWGRHWLDVVRYADTAGDNSDFPIPQMFLYRNWVIESFNRDLPYDEFVREQLAGDLLGGSPETARQRLIATGYIANARRFGSRVEDYPQHLTIEDTLDNLGKAFLATTINCARCHNHKFDPITTDDYYGLYGIFQSTRYPWPGIELEQRQRDLVPLIAADQAASLLRAHRQKQDELQARVQSLEKEVKMAGEATRGELRKQLEQAQRLALVHSRRVPFEQAYAVADAGAIDDAAIQIKGDPARRGPVVPRHFLTMLNGNTLRDDDRTSGRLQLADWIVDPANPLTSRVLANRIWLGHFGKGLVATPNDFGRQGRPPTHPALLDHLALRLIQSGWSLKTLHRDIVLSHTYRQSSRQSGPARERDPVHELLCGFPRRRLDAESLRDTLLLLGGHLDLSPGVSHPFPDPADWKFTQHNPFKATYETNRRSVYLMTQRIQRHPYLAIFDGPDPSASTPQRLSSTTPLQALYLLNDAFLHDQAAGLAARMLSSTNSDEERVSRIYRETLSRTPDPDERQLAATFLQQTRLALAESGVPDTQLDSQAWQAFARALFRLNEFVYVD